jgi:uncharacterized protein YkwD
MRVMRRSLLAAGIALATLCGLAEPAGAAPAPDQLVAHCTNLAAPAGTKPAALMFAELQCARKLARMPPLRTFKPIGRIATSWSGHLAAMQQLAHNPRRANQVTAVDPRWLVLGEIVGASESGPGQVDRIVSSWFRSSVHRHVIFNPKLRVVGIGIQPGGGWIWATCDFVDQA